MEAKMNKPFFTLTFKRFTLYSLIQYQLHAQKKQPKNCTKTFETKEQGLVSVHISQTAGFKEMRLHNIKVLLSNVLNIDYSKVSIDVEYCVVKCLIACLIS